MARIVKAEDFLRFFRRAELKSGFHYELALLLIGVLQLVFVKIQDVIVDCL